MLTGHSARARSNERMRGVLTDYINRLEDGAEISLEELQQHVTRTMPRCTYVTHRRIGKNLQQLNGVERIGQRATGNRRHFENPIIWYRKTGQVCA